ncbi:MAG: hypothetical protein U0869_10180 [Chloroflexota bacterium]
MSDDQSTRPAVPQVADEDDVEGHAFKWQVVSDPKTGDKRLRSGWTPDEPAGKPSTPRTSEKG